VTNFFQTKFFSALVLCTNWCTTICMMCLTLRRIIQFLRKVECNKFECKKNVSNLVQIDLIQFEFSNCIRSICTKTNTNLIHTNSLHSISHKIGYVIQIVVHQFVQLVPRLFIYWRWPRGLDHNSRIHASQERVQVTK
jgi:hypothetical protein